MNKLIIIPLTAMLTGCVYQKVLPKHYQAAEEYCESRGGVAGVVSVFQGSITIICKNSQKVSYGDFLDSRYRLEVQK